MLADLSSIHFINSRDITPDMKQPHLIPNGDVLSLIRPSDQSDAIVAG